MPVPTPAELAYLASLLPPDSVWQGTGAVKLTPDPRDWPVTRSPKIASLLATGAPVSASLLEFVRGQPYNQDGLGACVPASTSGVCSLDVQRSRQRWDTFNWLQLYHEAGGIGSNGVDSRLVLKICAEQGTPLATGGREKVITSYLFVSQTPGQFREEVKACIAAGQPVVVALLLPSDFGWKSGQPTAGVTQGYHQVCGLAYDPDYLIFLNSWGDWPGGASPGPGIGSVRWDYLEASSMQHNYCYAFTTASDAAPPPPPPPPIQRTLATVATGIGLSTLSVGQSIRGATLAGFNGDLRITQIDDNQPPPPPPPPPPPSGITVTPVIGPRRVLTATVQDSATQAYLGATCTATAGGGVIPATRPHTSPSGGAAIPATWRVPANVNGEIVVSAIVDGDARTGWGKTSI